ncbi:MAG: ATP-binding cassette domain-containing protein [Asticcacaulis sp.]
MSAFAQFFTKVKTQLRPTLRTASLCAAGVSIAAVALLGVSGWFLSGAAVAGAAGGAILLAFNYLLPSAAIRALAIARTALRYFERYLGHAAALRALALLRPFVFERLSRAQPAHLRALSRGDSSARLVQDVGVLESALVAQSAKASALGGLGAAVALNLFLSPFTALICALGLGISLALSYVLSRRARKWTVQTEMGAAKQGFFETMPFLPDIAAFDLSDRFMQHLTEQETKLNAARQRQADAEALIGVINPLGLGLTLGVIFLLNANAPLPMLALSLLVTTAGFESIGPLLKAISQKALFTEAERRVAELADLPAAVPVTLSGYSQFKYDGHDYHLSKQTCLLISGPSGSGKTQLIEALMGLRPTDDVTRLTDLALSPAQLSLCPQDAPVLNGTVRDNLMSEDENAIWHALKIAQLEPRIRKMPKGLDTWLGDGGIALSGGERKRLSLARALLRPAEILILDEPTEGLDPSTEAALVTALEAHLSEQSQGLILVSHRRAPQRLCDQHLPT